VALVGVVVAALVGRALRAPQRRVEVDAVPIAARERIRDEHLVDPAEPRAELRFDRVVPACREVLHNVHLRERLTGRGLLALIGPDIGRLRSLPPS
jgi:hypothetical protein